MVLLAKVQFVEFLSIDDTYDCHDDVTVIIQILLRFSMAWTSFKICFDVVCVNNNDKTPSTRHHTFVAAFSGGAYVGRVPRWLKNEFSFHKMSVGIILFIFVYLHSLLVFLWFPIVELIVAFIFYTYHNS